MPAAELDNLFEDIRRTRDPELLATLFERTAPWLLHRARLLLRRANLAEDVVQDLFLALLENGHGCEPGRPCLPYLLGMLHRRAARVRRQESRTLAQSLREAAAEGGPVDAAIGAEGRVTVRHAIDALPEPYREVVRRFLAQQSPAQIGRELGRTPNAVRVQLHRGLRLLRSTLPPGLVVLLWADLSQPLPAQEPWRRPVQLGAAATLAVAALATWVVIAPNRVDAVAANTVAAIGPLSASTQHAGVLDATSTPSGRTEVATAGTATLVLALRHADGSPAAAVGVLAHPAGRDSDFGATCAVSETDGRVVLRDLPAGPTTVLIDRGLQLCCSVPPATPSPQVVTLPEGVDVAGIVRDAQGQPAAGAGIWLCREPRRPSEGCVVAHAGDDGRFVLRGVQAMALLGAVREGSIPSLLHAIGSRPGEAELVLGSEGARMSGRVLGPNGAPVAGACVRVARHPRSTFQMPRGGETVPVHPCTIARTDAAGVFAVADLPPGPMQVLVRAPRHRTGLESIVLAPGKEHRLELRLHAGMDLHGDVRDQDGKPIANASVLAQGLVRNAWANVCTGPDGSFALAGLDPFRVLLEVDAPGFAPASVPVARDAGRISVVLHTEARVVLRLQDAAGEPARAPEWEVAACSADQRLMPEPLAPDGDGFVAAGELANGPFVVRKHGTQVWLRTEPGATPDLLRIPAAARELGSLLLSLPGTTPEQRADVVLLIERDGVLHPIAPADASRELLDFGRVPFGDNHAVFYSRTGLLPAVDLGVVAAAESSAPLTVDLPPYGWLRYRLQRTDREPVVQCQAFVTDERGLQVPLRGAEGRVALGEGRYRLWASSLSFPTVGQAFEVMASQETVLDLEMNPGKVRHVAFRLPPDTDPQQCRARVRGAGDRGGEGEENFPVANRGFDTTADGLCYTTLVLGEGEYLLDVRCGDRAFRSRFGVAGEDGVAEPIEVELRAER